MTEKTSPNGIDRAPAAAANGPHPLNLDDLLTYRISILAKLLDRRTAAMLSKDYGLSVAEWRVLAQLAATSPRTVRWLASEMRVDRAEVSRAAGALIARGLVVRDADPSDARSALFAATDAGRALYDQIMPRRIEQHESLARTLGARDYARFHQALDTLIDSLSGA